MSVGNRNFIASWGYRGLPIATSTEKRQRLISAPDGVEERNTLRTSEESEAETKRPPIKKKIPGANLHQAKTDLHLVQILHVVGMVLHLMQDFVLSLPFCL